MAVITGGNYVLPGLDGGRVKGASVMVNVVSQTAYGTSGESDTIRGCAEYTACIIQVKIASISGGSPTLNVYLQQLAADGTTWYDIASMTQITANGSYIQPYFAGGTPAVGFTAQDKALTAGVKAAPMGGSQRIALVYGGSMTSTINVGIEYLR